ncbi:MAG: MATE family efflux transporter [Oscillospiraceae bacterium]|nr:MATE family efflux transporter [Oscillospiraceae bacterium]
MSSARMGEMPEGRLLLSLSVPMMLSMLVQALYNVVDSIYVARVSEDCLAALSLAFPAQNIMIGLGTGTGVGVGTLISRALGRHDREEAARVAGTSVFLALCCWALMALFGLLGARGFVHSQTAVASIGNYAESYLRIVTIASLFLYLQMCMERLLQSTGQTRLSMWTQMAGALTNILLDPFFIFKTGDLLEFGGLSIRMPFGLGLATAGAALATVAGQAVAACVGLALHTAKNRELPIRVREIRPHKRIIGEVYRIGFPSILMMVLASVTNFIMNLILGAFEAVGATAVAVYGVYFKIQSFFFMPVFGLNSGMIPVIGYNYGARKLDRIHRTILWAVIYATCFMLLGLLLFQLAPRWLLSTLFDASGNLLEIGVHALRRISPSFLFAGFCIVAGSACQALGRSTLSFIVSVLRQVVGLIPAAWLLSLTGDVNMVWWCFPIAEIISVAASAFFLRSALRGVERELRA